MHHSRLWLCREHFNKFIENRVMRTIKRYNLIRRGDRVLLGLSGGKDSVVLAYILSKLRETIGFKLYLTHLNLGIGEYSKKTVEIVRKISEKINAPLIILDLREILSIGIPELALKTRRPPCSVCGVVKRYLLNALAVELKADSIATGHNLDDMVTFILREFLVQNLEQIPKLAPRIEGAEDYLATKIKPLYETYEEDIKKYAELNNIDYVEEKCPLADEKTITSSLKKHLGILENKFPGLTIGFIRRFVKNLEKYPKPRDTIRRCSICGMPSSGEVCSFCKITQKALGKPMGPYAREYIREIVRKSITDY
ncbi:PP-loop domain protein [Staphylothermus marinus F1]|uniref:PP-loop domain protein n=1 Tax=Staphylothermus marinus (strain ATCC 43588 / DSM 3639 / JCM 9404 / F1) TaxID=399550 RepID=A3DLJ8_STAMF|nr:PP-loop domain protein [Staphylothermus marinus F1]